MAPKQFFPAVSTGLGVTQLVLLILLLIGVVLSLAGILAFGITSLVKTGRVNTALTLESTDDLCQKSCDVCTVPSDCPSLNFKDLRGYLVENNPSFYLQYTKSCVIGQCLYGIKYLLPSDDNLSREIGYGWIDVKYEIDVPGTNSETASVQNEYVNNNSHGWNVGPVDAGSCGWEYFDTYCMGLLYPVQSAGIYLDCVKPRFHRLNGNTIECSFSFNCFINSTTYLNTQTPILAPLIPVFV